MRRGLRAVVREPMVGFFAVAALLLAGWRALGPDPDGTITVSRAQVDALVHDARTRLGRDPDDAERQALIDGWAGEEALYRDGLAMGLDRGDPIVRRRIVQRAEWLAEAERAEPPPDDAALTAWIAAHPDDYRVPARYDVVQRFFASSRADAEGDAERAVAVLATGRGASGDDPPGDVASDPFVLGEQTGLVPLATLAQRFGQGFADAVPSSADGGWHAIRSAYGWHAVRVAASEPARDPTLDDVRDRATVDWTRDRDARIEADALAAVRSRYTVVVEP